MSFDSHFNQFIDLLLKNYSNKSITRDQLIHSIDLTLLDENATLEELSQLNYNAKQQQVAAVCVFIQHLNQFSKENSINLATVINFPHGNETLDSSVASIEKARQSGAVEIDYVLPYRLYLEGKTQHALEQCHVIVQQCKQNKLTLKIILETGAFPETQTIYTVSHELIELGCDFIKTSTGKIPKGASLSAAFAILSAVKDSNAMCGIKLSGGVKKAQQAFDYAMLAELMLDKPIDKSWFRIGASSLLGDLLE